MIPRFLIDDTSDLGEARLFITHTQRPRFIGELFIDDADGNSEAPIGGVTIGISATEALANIEWIDDPAFDVEELAPALRAALDAHWSIRDGSARDAVREYNVSLAAKAGSTRSERKAAAARENGRRGGRPPKA